MSQPVHRPSRPPAQGDWGIAIPFFIGAMLVALVGFWPAMVWHGYTGAGGWRWDIHSTIAEAVYFGTVAFIAGLIWLGNRPARRVPPSGPPMTSLPPAAFPPRRCRHAGKVPVDLFTGERVAYLCPDCDTQLDEKGQPS